MPLYPRLIERQDNMIFLAIPNRPSAASYTIRALNVFDTSGFTNLFTVPVGGTYQSISIQRDRSWHVGESRTGLTTCQFNLDDFSGATIPPDGAMSFFTIAVTDHAGTTITNDNVVAVVPPASFYGTGRRNLLLRGTVGGPATGQAPSALPAAPLDTPCVVLPRFGDDIQLWNLDGPGANKLLVSFGTGTQELQLEGVASIMNNGTQFLDVGTNLIYLRGDSGIGASATVEFQLSASIVMGLQA